MRKLVVATFISLDGVMQAPGGPDEDRDGDFAHGGWVVPYIDDLLGRDDEVEPLTALLLGRRTYQEFAASWPLVGDDNPVAERFNRVPKYVASRTLQTSTLGDPVWHNSSVLDGEVADAVAELKAQPGEGEIQVHGSSDLIQTLLRHDLIDEYRIKIFPVLVGSGKRLFGDGTAPAGLKLTETTTSPGGVTMSTYTRDGELRTGFYGAEFAN
ncbi:dihydrofolate reductase family protein [Microlunatus soli]|uniref:Dihydrofolate reductase n=1 Tax=Microlunatus soli TaxID=630515 RepID=A0A1H1P3B1_9ACTN|nr:dihydrofolate reductase family protein [Microlunatus soli]SDS05707.1 Dihydrofolate reductase [Microlunatus soli]